MYNKKRLRKETIAIQGIKSMNFMQNNLAEI